MTAPIYRAIEQHTGQTAPTTMVAALAQLDRAITQRDDIRAELDNLLGLLKESQRQTYRLATELEHALNDRDEYRDRCYDLQDRIEAEDA